MQKCKYNKLNKKQLIILFRDYRKEARNILTTTYMWLVDEQINKYFPEYKDDEDIKSEGYLGLVYASMKFDLSLGYSFEFFATKAIYFKISNYLIKENNHKKMEEKQIKDINEENLFELELDEIYEDEELLQNILNIINTFPDISKQILLMHYGLYDGHIYKQHELSEIFNLGRTNVSMILTKSKRILINELLKINYIDLNLLNKEEIIKIIYDYFKEYSKKDILIAIKKIDGRQKRAIKKIYGNNFDDYKGQIFVSYDEKDRFFNSLIPNIEKMLKNPDAQLRKRR